MKYEWKLNIKTVSEANSSEHWSSKSKRHKLQKKRIKFLLLQNRPDIEFPCLIRLSRIAPRLLDSDDNLPMSLKYIKDYIADQLIPGLAPGRADDDKRMKWEYSQEKGKVREYAVMIQIQF